MNATKKNAVTMIQVVWDVRLNSVRYIGGLIRGFQYMFDDWSGEEQAVYIVVYR